MSLPVKKIYVDSRMKTKDSTSDSDFKFELSQSLTMPRNTTCYIDDVTIPHSWYNVDNTNNRLYVLCHEQGNTDYFIFPIPPGNYNGITLVNALMSIFSKYTGAYQIQASFDIGSNKLYIFTDKAETTFQIYTDIELTTMGPKPWAGGMTLDEFNLCSMNDLIQNTKVSYDPYSLSLPYTTGFINF